jgi:ABC-2 type transport system permease protein
MIAASRRRAALGVVLAVARAHLTTMRRYPGYLAVDAVLPVIVTLAPLLIGQALAGPDGARHFTANTGALDPRAYMLLGASQLIIVSGALWNLGAWMRRELQTGTLEALYLCPAPRSWILAGVCLYGLCRDLLVFLFAITVGGLVLGIDLLDLRLAVAVVFVALGSLSLYGMSLAYAGLVLRLKDVSALTQLAQYAVGLLLGAFFPIHVLPTLLQWLAHAFPPMWITQGVRAILLDVGWHLGAWYRDLAVVAAFSLVTPVLGLLAFRRADSQMRRRGGVGGY